MCVLAIVENPTPEIRRLIAHNRDEVRTRVFEAAATRDHDGVKLVYGRDAEKGGTWLAVSRDAFSAVLNIRQKGAPIRKDTSRGELPVPAVLSGSLGDFIEGIEPRDYSAFRLVRAGGGLTETFTSVTESYLGDVARDFTASNHARDDLRWFKESRLLASIKRESAGKPGFEALVAAAHRALEDRTATETDYATDTGFPPEFEIALSPIFVDLPGRDYGTVVSTVIAELRDGRTWVSEKNHLTGRTVTIEI